MIKQSENTHLTKAEIIKSGSIYTGPELVNLVFSQISEFITDNSVIADLGSGYGAFIEKFKVCGKRCFGTEYDNLSYKLLTEEYPNIQFYHENSLSNVTREKYDLNDNDHLIIVGNPPYNDTTSIFKKGEKGEIICDSDIVSRDFGISFLKAYNKLKADYICVLHPLAYLIKKQNFNSLGEFKNNYKLISAYVFSSKEFESIKKSNSDFPVVSALYKRTKEGMNYQDIQDFNFNIYNSNSKFILANISTIDGKINKYPKKAKITPSENISESELNHPSINTNKLQFYTLRDMNALYRNTSFLNGPIPNGIDVTMENLYQYSWLYFLKNNFQPKKNKFLFGNLSPLYTNKLEDESFKNEVVSYAVNNCELIKNYYPLDNIKALYGPLTNQYNALYEELYTLSNMFD